MQAILTVKAQHDQDDFERYRRMADE